MLRKYYYKSKREKKEFLFDSLSNKMSLKIKLALMYKPYIINKILRKSVKVRN